LEAKSLALRVVALTPSLIVSYNAHVEKFLHQFSRIP